MFFLVALWKLDTYTTDQRKKRGPAPVEFDA